MKLDLSGKTASEQLKVIRAFRGLSQDEAAALLDVTGAAVSNLETGARTPSLELATRIEREFNIPASSWIEQSTEGAA